MNILGLAKKLDGLQTISSISKILNVNKKTAVNCVSLLRRNGYVKETSYGSRKIRMYNIKTLKENEIGNPGFYEILDKNSKVKIYSPYEEDRIYDRKLSIEEAIIIAVNTKEFRTILASLGLFSKIRSWAKLNYYANKNNIGRKIGALYDVARTVIKVRRMDRRTRNSLLKSKVNNRYIVKNIKSNNLSDIEQEWNVYLPFNKADLEVYKE